MSALVSYFAHEDARRCSQRADAYTEPVPAYGFSVGYCICPAETYTNRAVLYVCGSGEEMHDAMRKCRDLAKAYDVKFVTFAYPGQQSHTESSAKRDLTEDAKFACALRVYDTEKCTSVWGRSMGACFAARIACERDVDVLVLEAPLASVSSYVKQTREYVGAFMSACGLDAYCTVSALKHAKFNRAYVLSMENDHVLASTHAREVFEAAKTRGVTELHVVHDADHNSLASAEEYLLYVPHERLGHAELRKRNG